MSLERGLQSASMFIAMARAEFHAPSMSKSRIMCFGSPSPRPSPPRRGRNARHCWCYRQPLDVRKIFSLCKQVPSSNQAAAICTNALELSATVTRSSLSSRERARVRASVKLKSPLY